MDYKEFFQRAMIAALPEASRHCRSKGKAAVAQYAKEQAKELCEVAGIVPDGRPGTTKLSQPKGRPGKK